MEGAAGVFGQEKADAKEAAVDLKALHAKIGELALENDFLSGALSKAGLLSASDDRPQSQPSHSTTSESARREPERSLLQTSAGFRPRI